MRFTDVTCAHCKKSFEKRAAEVKRQLKNRPSHNFFCSSECLTKFLNDQRIEYNKTCDWCKRDFTSQNKEKKCCSKTCAAKFSQSFSTKETRLKQSISSKLNFEKGLYPAMYRKGLEGKRDPSGLRKPPFKTFCEICNAEIITPRSKGKARKTCSKKCFHHLISKNSRANDNCGGKTNYKKFRYKSWWMDSSWEKEIAEFLDEKEITWERDKRIHFKWTDKSGKRRRYHPDFYLPDYDLYLEPKNKFLQEKDKFKIEQVIKEYGITLIVGDLQEILSFITNLEQ